MRYTQLTQEERYRIYAFKQTGYSQTEVAAIVGRDKGTISRELRRTPAQSGLEGLPAPAGSPAGAVAALRQGAVAYQQPGLAASRSVAAQRCGARSRS